MNYELTEEEAYNAWLKTLNASLKAGAWDKNEERAYAQYQAVALPRVGDFDKPLMTIEL